jgi:GTP-binding protein
MAELYDSLAALPHFEAEDNASEEQDEKPLKLVVMGRPNAGKSTLINALLAEDRLLTGPEAGITRDAIAVTLMHGERPVEIFDTAGLRKRANVKGKLEKLAVSDALRAMQYAEVVILLVDAETPLEKQDATLAALIAREGRACVLAVNKWDLVKAKRRDYLEEIDYRLAKQVAQLAGISVVPVSAAKGTGLETLLDACFTAREVWGKRVPTAALNRWLEGVIAEHTPPLVRGRRLKIKYMTQIKTRPPTFSLHCNMADEFPDAYLRYLERGLRETFGLSGTPIRLQLQASENPFRRG